MIGDRLETWIRMFLIDREACDWIRLFPIDREGCDCFPLEDAA